MKIRALICVWLVGLLGLAMCGAGLPDIGLSSGQGRYATGLRTGLNNGGGAFADTVKIRSRSVLFPNSAAIAAGYSKSDSTFYTFDNKADNGTAIKYATLQSGSPSTVYYSGTANGGFNRLYSHTAGTSTESDFAWPANVRLCFVWTSANGLKRNMKIERANLMINAGTGGVDLATNTNSLTVRLDTLRSDYGILTGTAVGAAYSSANDYNMFAASWAMMDEDLNTPWSPPLSDRDNDIDGAPSLDWHDFGPRSVTTYSGTYAAGYCFRFDVTDAVQQAVDKPDFDPDRGFLWVMQLYDADVTLTTYGPTFNAGNHPVVGAGSGKGLPVFTAVAYERRGVKPWNGVAPVPIAITFDDNKDYHANYMTVMKDHGLKFTAFNVVDWGTARSDSLYSAEMTLGNLDVVHHSKSHAQIGTLTGAALNAELELADYYVPPEWTVAADTAAIKSFGYPANGGNYYSLEAIARLVGYGYESARCLPPTVTSSIGRIQHLMWSRPMNMYGVASWYPNNIMPDTDGGGPTGVDASLARITEELTDQVNDNYTNGGVVGRGWGRAAIILYIHSYNVDGISAVELDRLLDAAESLGSVEPVNYYDLINARRLNAAFLDPAVITVGNGYNSYDATAAAKCDSFATANPGALGDNMQRVWIAPK